MYRTELAYSKNFSFPGLFTDSHNLVVVSDGEEPVVARTQGKFSLHRYS